MLIDIFAIKQLAKLGINRNSLKTRWNLPSIVGAGDAGVDWIKITIKGRRVYLKDLLFLEALGNVQPESGWIALGFPYLLSKEKHIPI